VNKWASLFDTELSGKTDWLLQYTNNLNNSGTNFYKPISSGYTGQTISSTSFGNQNLLPVSIKIAAQTIGMNLVAVKPMSAPIGSIFGMDFAYETPEEGRKKKRKERLKKLNKILRKEKLKYIDEILQKII